MMQVLIPAVILMAILGILFGFILAFASKKLEVKGSEKAKKLEEAMPGYNCGACGFPGCSGYAGALASGETTNCALCKPGKQEVVDKVKAILAESE